MSEESEKEISKDAVSSKNAGTRANPENRGDTRASLELAKSLFKVLLKKNMTLSTAESCTGGLLSAKITDVPGVSSVYAGGFVTYSKEEKHKMLGVSSKLLRESGAICRKTAKNMAEGCAKKTGTDVSISVTGNAGPAPSEGKPVGIVYIGICIDGKTVAKKYFFQGDRVQIRDQAVRAALELCLNRLAEKEKPVRKKKRSGNEQERNKK